MSLSFRVRRRAGIPPQMGPLSGSADIDDSYRDWRAAGDALRAAEQAGGPPDTILKLAAAVIRARNALTRAQISQGWEPSAAIMQDLERDEQLVEEADERRL
jgi:hypothetical protein